VKGLEMLSALSKHAIEGVAAADWPTNRAAMLGGQIACNISWQDTGTQATRSEDLVAGYLQVERQLPHLRAQPAPVRDASNSAGFHH